MKKGPALRNPLLSSRWEEDRTTWHRRSGPAPEFDDGDKHLKTTSDLFRSHAANKPSDGRRDALPHCAGSDPIANLSYTILSLDSVDSHSTKESWGVVLCP